MSETKKGVFCQEHDPYFIAKLESAEGPAHARNKARCYYNLCCSKKTPAHTKFAEKIKAECLEAIATGDWKPVTSMLSNLW